MLVGAGWGDQVDEVRFDEFWFDGEGVSVDKVQAAQAEQECAQRTDERMHKAKQLLLQARVGYGRLGPLFFVLLP